MGGKQQRPAGGVWEVEGPIARCLFCWVGPKPRDMLRSCDSCWAHDLDGIEGFEVLQASDTRRWSAEIGQVILMCKHLCASEGVYWMGQGFGYEPDP